MTSENGMVFGLKVDFDKSSPDPTRVFRTMTDMVISFQDIDAGLLKGVGVKVQSLMMLDDIERGSLKAIFRVLIELPKEATIASGDIKKVVGEYVAVSRKAIVKWMEKNDSVEDRKEILDLKKKLGLIAEETGVTKIGPYSPPQEVELVGYGPCLAG